MKTFKLTIVLAFTCSLLAAKLAEAEQYYNHSLSLGEALVLGASLDSCQVFHSTDNGTYLNCSSIVTDPGEKGISLYQVKRTNSSALAINPADVIPIGSSPYYPTNGCISSEAETVGDDQPCQITQTGVEKTITIKTQVPSASGTWSIELKEDQANKKIILTRKSEDSEPIVIKQFSGRYIDEVKPTSGISSQKRRTYCFFIYDGIYRVSDYTKGLSIVIIDRATAEIDIIPGPFSLSAPPIQDDDCVFYVGKDGNGIYMYNIDHETDILRDLLLTEEGSILVWENDSEGEIVDFSVASAMSFVKLRTQTLAGPEEVYKLFNCNYDLFLWFPFIEYKDVEKFQFLPRDNPNLSTDDIMDAALIKFGNQGKSPAKIVIHDWREVYHFTPFRVRYITKSYIKPYKTLAEAIMRIGQLSPACTKLTQAERISQCVEWVSKFDTTQTFQLELPQPAQGLHRDYHFVVPYSFTIKTPNDHLQVPVNVWPALGADPETPKPLIIHIHGGPDEHEDIAFRLGNQYWAMQGCWVACPEARGSTGYGQFYRDALISDWGGGHLDDIVAVIDHFKADPRVDSDNILIIGSSFGGYATMMASTDSRFAGIAKAFVSIAGVSNVGKAFSEGAQLRKLQKHALSAEDYLESWIARVGPDVFKKMGLNVPNLKISPINELEKLHTPILLIHGLEDQTVLPNQSKDFYTFANEVGQGRQVHLLEIAGEDHHFRSTLGFISYWHVPLQFFQKAIADNLPEGDHYTIASEAGARRVFASPHDDFSVCPREVTAN